MVFAGAGYEKEAFDQQIAAIKHELFGSKHSKPYVIA